MTALLNALIPHAESGALVHLVISDNFVRQDESTNALCELVRNATNLQLLHIDGLELTGDRASLFFEALKESKSKSTLADFSWGYDLEESDDFVEDLEGLSS